jgi:hypothetical protein
MKTQPKFQKGELAKLVADNSTVTVNEPIYKRNFLIKKFTGRYKCTLGAGSINTRVIECAEDELRKSNPDLDYNIEDLY